MEEDANKWKAIPYSWIEKNNIDKNVPLSKAIYWFGVISVKIPMTFCRNEKYNL